jgi:predicted membrane-bound spermidine synthase
VIVWHNGHTPFQHILLYERNGHIRLLLDGYYQFDSRHERVYHEMIASLPMALARGARRALVMGGGDGLALREILRYPVKEAWLVELDPEMLKLASAEPLAGLNDRSMYDRRTHAVATDARRFVDDAAAGGRTFDVVIADFPALTDMKLAKLYSPEFYDSAARLVASGGVFVQQISEPGAFGEAVRRILEGKLGHAVRIYVSKGPYAMESFVMASDSPFEIRRPIPHDASFLRSAWPKMAAMLASGQTQVNVRLPRRDAREFEGSYART